MKLRSVRFLADIDPELWFVLPRPRCRGGRDFLFDKHWLTHPGRMAAYCRTCRGARYAPGFLPVRVRYSSLALLLAWKYHANRTRASIGPKPAIR